MWVDSVLSFFIIFNFYFYFKFCHNTTQTSHLSPFRGAVEDECVCAKGATTPPIHIANVNVTTQHRLLTNVNEGNVNGGCCGKCHNTTQTMCVLIHTHSHSFTLIHIHSHSFTFASFTFACVNVTTRVVMCHFIHRCCVIDMCHLINNATSYWYVSFDQ